MSDSKSRKLATVGSNTPTKGNIIVGDGNAFGGRIVGTNGAVLRANSAEADGVEWHQPQEAVVDLATTTVTVDISLAVPAGTKQIDFAFSGITLSATSSLYFQLGYGGTPTWETANYDAVYGTTGSTNSTVGSTTAIGLQFGGYSAVNTFGGGSMMMVDTNQWVISSQYKYYYSAAYYFGNAVGSKTIGGELTALRITTSAAQTFSAGKIRVAFH